jgi:tRNA A-37 threonylcarbamoyl transferase component Bud32
VTGAPNDLETIRQALGKLKLRLAGGEITREAYRELVEDVSVGLAPTDRAALGLTPTPLPARPGSSPRPSPRVGPSGLCTKPPHLNELDLAPGAVLFDKFRIVRELGRGGFGAVFEAERVGLRKTYAVKVLDPAMVVREELLARFRREVIVMQGLVHPHIGRVFDYDERTEEGLALFAMEFIQGCTVRDLVQTAKNAKQPVPIELALTILGQTLEALAEAHAQGVIHRDVTPGNILLAGGSAEQLLEGNRDPQVKLVDFGIAGLADRSELSQKSRVLGVPAYIAPEVIDPTQPVTAAADVYGAGAVAYELLTGVLPFGRFPAPGEIREELVGEVEDLLLALLDVRPLARPNAEQAGERAVTAAAHARAVILAQREEQAQRERDAEEARRGAEEERAQAEAERVRLEQERREAEERAAQEAERQWRQQRNELLERFERQIGSGDPKQIGAAEATLAELSSHCAGRVTSDVDLEALRQALEQARRDWLADRGALIEAAQHAGDVQEVRRLLGGVGAIDDPVSSETVNLPALAPWFGPAQCWLQEQGELGRFAETGRGLATAIANQDEFAVAGELATLTGEPEAETGPFVTETRVWLEKRKGEQEHEVVSRHDSNEQERTVLTQQDDKATRRADTVAHSEAGYKAESQEGMEPGGDEQPRTAWRNAAEKVRGPALASATLLLGVGLGTTLGDNGTLGFSLTAWRFILFGVAFLADTLVAASLRLRRRPVAMAAGLACVVVGLLPGVRIRAFLPPQWEIAVRTWWPVVMLVTVVAAVARGLATRDEIGANG